MAESPSFYRVRAIAEAARDLQLIQLQTELDFYKALSLEFGAMLERVVDELTAGGEIEISIGRKPAVIARRRGRKGK